MRLYHILILGGIPYEQGHFLTQPQYRPPAQERLTFKYCHGICRPHSDFITFPNKDFYSKRSQFDGFSCFTADQSVWNSFSVFLSLHDLGTFEDYRVFCRLSLSLHLWCFLNRFRWCIFDRDSAEVVSSFFLHPIIIFVSWLVMFNQLNKVLFARLCNCRISLFPLIIIDHFVEGCFETMYK